jgi:hypothetical protein
MKTASCSTSAKEAKPLLWRMAYWLLARQSGQRLFGLLSGCLIGAAIARCFETAQNRRARAYCCSTCRLPTRRQSAQRQAPTAAPAL